MVQKSHLRSSFSRKMYVHIQVHIQPTNINVSLNQKGLCNAKKKMDLSTSRHAWAVAGEYLNFPGK